jgi:hypothetical protein
MLWLVLSALLLDLVGQLCHILGCIRTLFIPRDIPLDVVLLSLLPYDIVDAAVLKGIYVYTGLERALMMVNLDLSIFFSLVSHLDRVEKRNSL